MQAVSSETDEADATLRARADEALRALLLLLLLTVAEERAGAEEDELRASAVIDDEVIPKSDGKYD